MPGLVPEWTFRLIAGRKMRMLELHIPGFAPSYPLKSPPFWVISAPEDTGTRDPQFLFGDRRFYEGEDVHIDQVVAAGAQNLLEKPRRVSITPVLIVQIRSFASFFLLWNQVSPPPFLRCVI